MLFHQTIGEVLSFAAMGSVDKLENLVSIENLESLVNSLSSLLLLYYLQCCTLYLSQSSQHLLGS